MAFKRVLVLIQVGVASLHRRQAHEHKTNKMNKNNRITKQKYISLEQTLPSEKGVCEQAIRKTPFFTTRQFVFSSKDIYSNT